MLEWKWTKGEPYERSRRIIRSELDNPQKQNENDFEREKQLQAEYIKSIESTAYSSSLHHDENTWEIMNQNFAMNMNDFRQNNKREDTDKRMAERQMVTQISMNPYLVNNNYLADIETRDNYLKPQSTNGDREKKNE